MNLLSGQQKDGLYAGILARFFGVALVIVSFWGAVFLVFAYTSVWYLAIQIPALEQRLANEQNSETSRSLIAIDEEIGKLNATLSDIEKVRNKKSLYFPSILRKMTELMPSGVTLKRVSFHGQSMSIEGRADQRTDAFAFKGKLESDSLCKKLSSPLIVKEKNIDFNFTCAITTR